MQRSLLVVIGILLATSCFGATHYVVTNGTPGHTGPVNPYTNWATAGTNIIDVVNAAMTNTSTRLVWVSNGTYYLTNQVTVSNALTLQSVNGREVTIVDGNNYAGKPVTNRCFYLFASGAVLDGFTVTNGLVSGDASPSSGGGIYGVAGTVIKNCRITGCVATNTAFQKAHGGGVHVAGGVITNCEVIGNFNYWAFSYGAGIYVSDGGLATDCTIASNINEKGFGCGIAARGGSAVINNCRIYGNTSSDTAIGGVSLGAGATVRNSLIYNNRASGGGGVGIVEYTRGNIQNCTIVSNIAYSYPGGGGIWINAESTKTSIIENTICYLNTDSAVATRSNVAFYTSAPYTGSFHIVNSCIAPTNSFPTNGIEGYYYANNIESNPQFVNKDADDWRLSVKSACVNKGTNQEWMTNSVDLDNRIRIRYGTVDVGCYETIYEGTIYRLGF